MKLRLREKTTATLLIAIFMISTLAVIIPAMAKPQSITVSFNQAQFQWRASAPYGAWSYTVQNSPVTEEYNVSGNVLHTFYSYSPVVTELEGEKTIYNFDKKSGLWIEREGTVKYKYLPGYGDHYIVNYWKGYLNFNGDPGPNTFIHGVAYQWVYLAAPQSNGGVLPYAQWDPVMDMWLLGFSIYLWDTGAQSYSVGFPDPFPEPVPANIYNPLGE